MKKIRTTITIDKKLLKAAKHHHIRISTFLDRKLRECLSDFNEVFDEPFCQKGSGYDVALTWRRSSVQISPSPLIISKTVKLNFSPKDIEEFLNIIELSGISKGHKKEVKRAIENYAKYILFRIDKRRSLEYFSKLQKKYSIAYYKKQMCQIRKFLSYLGIEWSKEIKLPPDPIYVPKRICIDDINNAISFFQEFSHFTQIKAIILLGATSGMRAEEIYQLRLEDIVIENRIIHINHKPDNGQSTKTKRSRVTFFNEEAKKALCEYLEVFDNNNYMSTLFSQTHIKRLFTNAPVRVKDLRKFFSQEWDRRGGPTSIKKILMGHSLKNDVDLMHYNAQSEEDLKKIYDRVMAHTKIIHKS